MKTKFRWVLVLIFFTVFSFDMMAEGNSANSQEKIVLTLEEAKSFAISNSRTLKSAAIDVEIAKLKKDNAWNVFIPSVQVTGTMSRSNEVSDAQAAMMDGIMSGFMDLLMPLYMKHPD